MNRETVISLPKKVKKIVLAGRIISTAVLVGIAVYRLIPKDEKITGINTDSVVTKYTR